MKQHCNECSKKAQGPFTPQVLEIINKTKPAFFYKVVVPASVGDDTTLPPDSYDYRNILLYYEANKVGYLFDSAGIATKIAVDPLDFDYIQSEFERLDVEIKDLDEEVAQHYEEFKELDQRVDTLDNFATTEIANLRDITGDLQRNIEQEASDRRDADNGLQAQIDGLANSSDVVDVVDTYAQLEAYDTSKIHDNDIIKVLQDETRNGATTYYRYSVAGTTGRGDEIQGITTVKMGDAYTYDEETRVSTFDAKGGATNWVTPQFVAPQGMQPGSTVYWVAEGHFDSGVSSWPSITGPNYETIMARVGEDFYYEAGPTWPFNGGGATFQVIQTTAGTIKVTFYGSKTTHWAFIGAVGPYYTKAEADERFVTQEEIAEVLPARAKNLPKDVVSIPETGSSSRFMEYYVNGDRISPQLVHTNLDNGSTSNTLQATVFPLATAEHAGAMSIADKAKLDSIPEGGGGGDVLVRAQNLPQYMVGGEYQNGINSWTRYEDKVIPTLAWVDLDTGNTTLKSHSNSTLPAATSTAAGVMSAEDKRNLDALVEGGGGSSSKLYSEYGDNEDGALTQKFVSDKLNGRAVILGNQAEGKHVRDVIIGENAHVNGSAAFSNIVIGPDAYSSAGSNAQAVAIGDSAKAASEHTIALGTNSWARQSNSVALGYGAQAHRFNEVSIGRLDTDTNYGPVTRLLSGVTAGELDTDAVNKKQMEDYVAEHGGGGGELAEAYGDSSTTALSQKFLSGKLNGEKVQLGLSSTATGTNKPVAVGQASAASGNYSTAVGGEAKATNVAAVALGAKSVTARSSEVSLGNGIQTDTYYGTRYLANVRDGELPQDAVTVNQLNNAVGDINTLLETLISGEGAK